MAELAIGPIAAKPPVLADASRCSGQHRRQGGPQ